jgi:RNA polymerase sigma-70 factor, ECF subfamily
MVVEQTVNTNLHDSTDEELLEQIQRGEQASLTALYDRHRSLAYALALRVVRDPQRAEDVVQDAFLSVWRKAASYALGRGSARTWLSSIVRNRAIDLVRASREQTLPDDRPLLGIVDPRPAVDDEVAVRFDGERIRAAILQLPDDQRQAINLAFYSGLSHSEISAETGIPLGTVKSRIRLGMQRLRSSLAGQGYGFAQ